VNHDVDLCFRYCVSKPPWFYISFQQAILSVLETNKSHRGEVWDIRRVRQQLSFVRVDNLHCSCGGMGWGVIVKKGDIFPVLTWDAFASAFL
jgi:hypothetical protein